MLDGMADLINFFLRRKAIFPVGELILKAVDYGLSFTVNYEMYQCRSSCMCLCVSMFVFVSEWVAEDADSSRCQPPTENLITPTLSFFVKCNGKGEQ